MCFCAPFGLFQAEAERLRRELNAQPKVGSEVDDELSYILEVCVLVRVYVSIISDKELQGSCFLFVFLVLFSCSISSLSLYLFLCLSFSISLSSFIYLSNMHTQQLHTYIYTYIHTYIFLEGGG